MSASLSHFVMAQIAIRGGHLASPCKRHEDLARYHFAVDLRLPKEEGV